MCKIPLDISDLEGLNEIESIDVLQDVVYLISDSEEMPTPAALSLKNKYGDGYESMTYNDKLVAIGILQKKLADFAGHSS